MTEEQAIERIDEAIRQRHSGLDSRASLIAITAWNEVKAIAREARLAGNALALDYADFNHWTEASNG